MKNLIVALFAALCLLACKQRKHIECIRPYTVKEQALIDSLKQKGQTAEISRFNYPYLGDSLDQCMYYVNTTYSLHIENLDSSYINKPDSMRSICRKMASELYNNIIENSILIYTDELVLSFVRKPYKPKKKIYLNGDCDYKYVVKIKKDDMENYFGFKVVETKNGFSRIQTDRKVDSLVFVEDYFPCEW